MKQYIVDTFTDKPFSGNPAAVCVMDSWPDEISMMKLASDFRSSDSISPTFAGLLSMRWFRCEEEMFIYALADLFRKTNT